MRMLSNEIVLISAPRLISAQHQRDRGDASPDEARSALARAVLFDAEFVVGVIEFECELLVVDVVRDDVFFVVARLREIGVRDAHAEDGTPVVWG